MIINAVTAYDPGAVAERLTRDETDALLRGAHDAATRLATQVRQLGLQGEMRDEARALTSAVSKIGALLTVGEALEIRVVHRDETGDLR